MVAVKARMHAGGFGRGAGRARSTGSSSAFAPHFPAVRWLFFEPDVPIDVTPGASAEQIALPAGRGRSGLAEPAQVELDALPVEAESRLRLRKRCAISSAQTPSPRIRVPNAAS